MSRFVYTTVDYEKHLRVKLVICSMLCSTLGCTCHAWFLVKMPPSSLFVCGFYALCRFINGQFDSISAEVVDDNWRIASMQNSVRQRSLTVAMVIAREEPEWEFCFCGLIWTLG